MISRLLPVVILAEASFDLGPFANYGALGLMLAWFLWRAEPRMRAVESAIDRQSATMLIFMIEIDRTSPQAKKEASIVLQHIQKAQRERGEPESGGDI